MSLEKWIPVERAPLIMPGVPLATVANGKVTFYPHGEMRRICGTYRDGEVLQNHLRGRRPPGKKAREVWGALGPWDLRRLEHLKTDHEEARGIEPRFETVRVDRRTGVAYTYEWGRIPSEDELSPWRRGVLR